MTTETPCSGTTLLPGARGIQGRQTVKEANHEEALRRLITLHGRTVRAVLARLEADRLDVEELFDDVFLLAYERIEVVDPLPSKKQLSWLLRTARHLVLNHARRKTTRRTALERQRREPVPLVPSAEDEFALIEESMAARRRSNVVREALSHLAPKQRQILVLDAYGWSGPRIAEELGTTAGAARLRLMRARDAYRGVAVMLEHRSSDQGEGVQ